MNPSDKEIPLETLPCGPALATPSPACATPGAVPCTAPAPGSAVATDPSSVVIDIQSAFVAPDKIIWVVEKVAIGKATRDIPRTVLLAVLTGMMLGMGLTVAVTVGKGVPSLDPGLQKFLFGAMAPVSLFLIALTGGELFTVNCAFMVPAILNGKVKWWRGLLNLCVVYLGNCVGAMSFAYFFAFLPQLFQKDPWCTGVRQMAESKAALDFWVTFLLAICSSWMLCLAVYLANAGKTIACKVVVSWFPVQSFMTIGYPHCISDMFLVPLGIMYGADCSWGDFIARIQVPVVLGNAVAAILFVGLCYWYIYGIEPNWSWRLFARCPKIRHSQLAKRIEPTETDEKEKAKKSPEPITVANA